MRDKKVKKRKREKLPKRYGKNNLFTMKGARMAKGLLKIKMSNILSFYCTVLFYNYCLQNFSKSTKYNKPVFFSSELLQRERNN